MTKFDCYITKLMGFYQYKYNKAWDVLLNKLIDHGEVIGIDFFKVSIKLDEDIFEVWLQNKPYASHILIKKNEVSVPEKLTFSPSIKTQLKFEKWFSPYKKQGLTENLFNFYGENND